MQSNVCFIRHGWTVLSKDSFITCLFMYKQYCQWNWYNTMKSSICFKYEACLQPMRIEIWYQYLFKIFLNQHMLCILSFKVMFELIPKHRSAVTSDQHVLIINNSPIEYGHSLLVPSINSCLPQVFALNDFLMNWFVCLFVHLPLPLWADYWRDLFQIHNTLNCKKRDCSRRRGYSHVYTNYKQKWLQTKRNGKILTLHVVANCNSE